MSTTEERLRVLRLIESGQVNAEEGSRLLDALTNPGEAAPRSRTFNRTLRVRVTDLASGRQKVNVTIPSSLLDVGVKLGARLLPRGSTAAIEDIQRMIEAGSYGRIYEMQDLEEGERVEIFVE
ncbi:MAG: hypothetical protein H7Z42_04290 [Roseiflexaceae bacterium]|nr:hypothetical protein [Roseiflexaceae bacterium]